MPKPSYRTVDEYFAQLSEPARTTLSKVRAVILATVPEGTEELISYGMPAYKYKGMLFGFAAFKDHCSLFAMNPALQSQFTEELKAYPTSKGAIRFALDKPFATPLLKRLLKARIAQNEEKKSRK
jgi:uncharacterized protein YdhG (YjbR/CyaY superfamily)